MVINEKRVLRTEGWVAKAGEEAPLEVREAAYAAALEAQAEYEEWFRKKQLAAELEKTARKPNLKTGKSKYTDPGTNSATGRGGRGRLGKGIKWV